METTTRPLGQYLSNKNLCQKKWVRGKEGYKIKQEGLHRDHSSVFYGINLTLV